MVTTRSTEGCAKCAGRKYVIERRDNRALARACDCSERCDVCSGTGSVYATREETFSQKVGPRKYEVLVPCACALLRRRIARFNEVELPGVLAHASFDNYRASSAPAELAKHVALDFAHHYRKDGDNKGFIISGPVGTGKTHLLAATLSHLVLEGGAEARYVEISFLYATIRKGFKDGKSGGEIIGPLSEVEVLAIDELGKGRGSQFELDTLDELISRRYNAKRTTLFATNYALAPEKRGSVRTAAGYQSSEGLKQAAAEPELLLRERVGERIYSRLCEMCTFVELPRETPDQRRTKQELDPRLKALSALTKR
jgi:DNA replication protein DnaC